MASRPDKMPGATSSAAARNSAAQPDSTKTPQHKLPVSGAGPMTLTQRQGTPAVTGPTGAENGRGPLAAVGGARLAGGTPQNQHPTGADCCGGNCA